MPFQPLPDNTPGKPASFDLGILVIRLITAFAFIYYELASELRNAVQYVWEQSEWSLIDQFAEKGLPLPNVLSVVFVALITVALLGVAIGIFSRINGILLTLATGALLLVPIDFGAAPTPQTLVLFLGIFLGIALGGAGKISLDFILAGRKAKRK